MALCLFINYKNVNKTKFERNSSPEYYLMTCIGKTKHTTYSSIHWRHGAVAREIFCVWVWKQYTHGFFQVLIKTCERIYVATAGKSALKLGNLWSLKVIRQQRANAAQSRDILQTFVWWGSPIYPQRRNLCKIRRLCGAISLRAFNKSRSNLASLLTLRRPFQLCWRIFANRSQSKVDKTVEGSEWANLVLQTWNLFFL